MRKTTLPRGLVRVAVYLRVSTAKQLKGYGLKAQLDSIHAWLDYKTGKGRYIVEVYEDGGVSGKLSSRPRLDAMNMDIAAGKFDLVVFGKLDRIGRTMKDIHRWVYDTTDIEAAPGRKVRVATADGRIDSEDEMFGLQLSLLAYMAEVEHALILERTASGRENKFAEGGWAAGRPPYGIRLDGKGRDATPVVAEDEARIISKAADFVIDDKMSPRKAAEELNRLGLYTRSGRAWTGANLRNRLMSTALLGYFAVRDPEGTSAATDEDGKFLYGDSYRIPLPEILPSGRVQALRAAIQRRSRPKGPGMFYMLSGRFFGLCGAQFIGAAAGPEERVYRCTGSIAEHPNYRKCGCSRVSAAEVERLAWDAIADGLRNRDHLTALAGEWLGSVPARAESYRTRIADLEASLERKRKSKKTKILNMLALMDDEDGEIDGAMVQELKQTLQQQEDAIRQELQRTREWLQEAEAQEQRIEEIMLLSQQVTPDLDNLGPTQKEDLMDLFHITVHVTGPARRVKVRASGVEKWFAATGHTVPGPLTDEQWKRIAPLVPDRAPGERNQLSQAMRREVFDGIFHKARSGGWEGLPGHYPPAATLRVYAWRLLTSGWFDKAIEALGDYEGTPLPSRVTLPDLDIRLSPDKRGVTSCDVFEQSSRTPFAHVRNGYAGSAAA